MSKIMKKIIYILTVTIISLGVVPSYAVDTTETFAPGVFTDFETYYTAGFGSGGVSHGLDFLVGGGFTENLSYTLTTGISNSGDMTEVGSFGIGLLWTAVNMEKFAFDFMPSFSFIANDVTDKITYPNMEAFAAGLDLEFNLTILKPFQPFLVTGFSYSYDSNLKEGAWEIPLILGAMIPVKDGVEFLLQLGWTPMEDATWRGSERTISAGFNIGATENLEVITEVGWEFNEKNFSLSTGLIYAL